MRFFHDLIASSPEGWIDLASVLSCPKMKALSSTAEEVAAALSSSHLEIKNEGDKWILRRSGPLPELVSRERHSIKHKPDPHRAGCIVKLSKVPEEVSWQGLKDAVNKTLPLGAKLSFVSTIKKDGECMFLSKAFDDDKKFFSEMALEINGAKVSCTLADATEATAFISSLPQLIKRNRERDLQRCKRKAMSREIFISGTKFASVDHLRQCIRELIQKTAEGDSITTDSPAFNVIKALLAYHPRSSEKLHDLAHFKVAMHTGPEGESKGKHDKPSKCLFVVRTNGEAEDFSVNKCVIELSKNPPFSPPQEANAVVDAAGPTVDAAEEHVVVAAEPTADAAQPAVADVQATPLTY